MSDTPPVGRTAFLLGFAGLLPQIAAVVLIVVGKADPTDMAWAPLVLGYGLALVYGATILSFLGGIWWGFAMRRDAGQGALAAIAVLPSLVGAACVGIATIAFSSRASVFALLALGIAILLTLLVDRRLVEMGKAPANWMRLRAPLSLGLGGLTIVAAVILAS